MLDPRGRTLVSPTRRAQNRPSRRSTAIGIPYARPRTSALTTSSIGPAATARPSARTSACPKPGGISSTWCDTSTIDSGRALVREPGEVADQRLSCPEVQPCSRLVEQQQVGVGHERPGDRHAPPLPAGQGPERMVRHARDPEALDQRRGTDPVRVVVHVPPRGECRVARAEHELRRAERLVHLGLEGTPRVADPAALFARVHPPEPSTEHVHRPGSRPQVEAHHLEQGGLARAVRAEDGPALTRADGPVERSEDRPPTAA